MCSLSNHVNAAVLSPVLRFRATISLVPWERSALAFLVRTACFCRIQSNLVLFQCWDGSSAKSNHKVPGYNEPSSMRKVRTGRPVKTETGRSKSNLALSVFRTCSQLRPKVKSLDTEFSLVSFQLVTAWKWSSLNVTWISEANDD